MKKVSVIVPCHNLGEDLNRCVKSLLNQTIGKEQLQIILVDDASTDDTPQRIQSWAKKEPEVITPLLLTENLRQGGARNQGLSLAEAPYVGYVDGDDWVEPLMYEHMLEKAESFHTDVVFCRHKQSLSYELWEDVKLPDRESRFLTVDTNEKRKEFIVGNLIGYGVWDKLFSKEFLVKNDLKFPEHIAYEDITFGSLVYLYASRIFILEETLYHYYMNPESTVHKRNVEYHKDFFKANEIKWQEYEKRGAFSKLKDAVEFDYMMTAYVAAMKLFVIRYDEFPYEAFCSLQQTVQQHIPNIMNNPYVAGYMRPMQKMVLELLPTELSREEATQVAAALRQYMEAGQSL